MENNKLKFLRDKINYLDDQMINLLDQRSNIVEEIGKLKDQSKGVVDKNREQLILNRLINLSKGKYTKDSIIRIWREIFETSSKLQLNFESMINTKRSIENISVYKGGKSEIKGIKNIIKLSSNENPFGPSKKIGSKISTDNLNRYPEISGETLRKKLALIHNINFDQIILGCGSDETLLFAALSFCQSGDEIIHAKHSFEMYPIVAKVVGAVSKLVKEVNYKITVRGVMDEITPATKLIYIANPNNPTGTYLNKNDIRELMFKIPKNIIVVLDQAYCEYVDENDYDKNFSLVSEFENIILTRTFSKAYGLAGIRLGWCYSSLRVSSIIAKVKGPFNINTFAQNLALIALDDFDHLEKVVSETKKIKNWFEKELKKLNIKVNPSFANFSFIESKEETILLIYSALEENGIIVRQLYSYGLPSCLRISIGTFDNMKKVISVLKKIL